MLDTLSFSSEEQDKNWEHTTYPIVVLQYQYGRPLFNQISENELQKAVKKSPCDYNGGLPLRGAKDRELEKVFQRLTGHRFEEVL